MFSTDVAARGLDFPNIDWVVQFDAPEDPAAYIHRVGRAGRFRSKGNALTFVLPSEEAAFLDMMAEARIPVAEAMDYSVQLASKTAGRGVLSVRFDGYAPCPPGMGKTAKRRGPDPRDRDRYILTLRSAMTRNN